MAAKKESVNRVQQASASETWYDQDGVFVQNESEIPTGAVLDALKVQQPEIAQMMGRWRQGITQRGQGGIFQRDRYLTPPYLFDQFRMAKDAAENDDVVSGVLASTESMAFSKMSFACDDEDQEDVWNQIAENMDLDSRMREMWRDITTVSQCYIAVWYKRESFKVRGESNKSGVKRKKTFNNLLVPTDMSLLDPLKVVPVGNFLFGQEQLAYIANRGEAAQFDETLANSNSSDLIVTRLITGKYEPTRSEKNLLADECGDVDLSNLYLLNPKYVFRHTATRPAYERFANCDMKAVFELLDLKNQLREMDRASLLGGTNFIVLVKIGSDDLPAKPAEVQALAGMAQAAARTPVIVGDHRLNVEIVTPKQDQTLKPERYNTIDARITSRMYKILMTGNYASGTKGDDSITLSRVIAAGLESTRHMMRRTLEKHVFRPTMEANEQLTEYPSLEFHPKRIALDFDANLAAYYQDLRDRGDISRQTVLEQVDLDESQEAKRREREDEKWEETFVPTNVPYFTEGATGQPGQTKPGGAVKKGTATTPKAVGRRSGGTKNGGGANPKAGRPKGATNKPTE